MKIFTRPPLPFQGNKTNFRKTYLEVIQEILPADTQGSGWTMLDVFGGSGLLSHTTKRSYPACRVVYNDFDGYWDMCQNVPYINELRGKLWEILANCGDKQKLNKDEWLACMEEIARYEQHVPWQMIKSWLNFSGNDVANLKGSIKDARWKRLPQTDYFVGDYFEGLERVSEDFRTLMARFKDDDKTLFVLDPPYIAVDQSNYSKNSYFRMADFLDLMGEIRKPFIFFSSNKSDCEPFIQWAVKTKYLKNWQAFEGYKKHERKNHLNQMKSTHYRDQLIYNF